MSTPRHHHHHYHLSRLHLWSPHPSSLLSGCPGSGPAGAWVGKESHQLRASVLASCSERVPALPCGLLLLKLLTHLEDTERGLEVGSRQSDWNLCQDGRSSAREEIHRGCQGGSLRGRLPSTGPGRTQQLAAARRLCHLLPSRLEPKHPSLRAPNHPSPGDLTILPTCT